MATSPSPSPISVASCSSSANNPLLFQFLTRKLPPYSWPPKPFCQSVVSSTRTSITSTTAQSTKQPSSSPGSAAKYGDEYLSLDAIQRFIQLNLGNWTGTFHQFDSQGNLMHKISTKLAAGSYGEDELTSLIQTLYIKQPRPTTSFSAVDDDEPEWSEYKIKETNMFTMDKYQQIGFFPKERAFALRYQTAGMLETVLRQGVLGEDDIGEESPKNLKLPSRRPCLVCENCLYSLEKDRRVRALHVLNPKGILDMLFVFLEDRGGTAPIPPTFDDFKDDRDRIKPYLGTWKGHSVTKRSGVYGATLARADTVASLEINKDGRLIQDIASTLDGRDFTTHVHWTGTMSKNLVTFDGGFQLTLLPGGIYMGCPCDVSKCVQESKSFHLEFCWLESPGKRQRLVRTYDAEGLAVSSTYFLETKV